MPITAEDCSAVCWAAGWSEAGLPEPGHEKCPEPYTGQWGCQCACHPLSPMAPKAIAMRQPLVNP